MTARIALLFFAIAAAAAAQQSNPTPPPQGTRRDPGLFRGEKGKGEENVRSVAGVVRNTADGPVEGAIVQLKDTKSLKVRSFITQETGAYQFHGLSTNVDYELLAKFKDLESDPKTLSLYDSRKAAVINLKVATKKEREQEKAER